MKKNNRITEAKANKFFDELQELFNAPAVPNLEQMSQQTVTCLSKHFNLNKISIDISSIKKLETFFQSSERQLSQITKLLFISPVATVFGQVLCTAYGGEWSMAENPLTAKGEVAILFLDRAVPLKVFPCSLVANFFFKSMHEFKLSDMIESIGRSLNTPLQNNS